MDITACTPSLFLRAVVTRAVIKVTPKGRRKLRPASNDGRFIGHVLEACGYNPDHMPDDETMAEIRDQLMFLEYPPQCYDKTAVGRYLEIGDSWKRYQPGVLRERIA